MSTELSDLRAKVGIYLLEERLLDEEDIVVKDEEDIVITTVSQAAIFYAEPLFNKTPYHTSVSGHGWIQELIDGHPEQIRDFERSRAYQFKECVFGGEACYVFIHECDWAHCQTCCEHFQCANDTISKYFKEILFVFSSTPIYTNYVHLPSANDPMPPKVLNNPKFYPFFSDAIGAIDGTHITCAPSTAEL
ncbi:hypothetical protein SERLA73DRAFT_71733 [Serpula lacrymans var. lacrymans S7.3]|uniref:DDE Tnp4 domain-containing protein n=2 Tax=Serpula lacrymans var. lacrymans TaxID=341189 RepID=F8PSJ6_SERL3|nr:uncharacterized protein SERLADRAFT_436135 [Serpula lacrymans var. lacrymans S7.9]EGO00755.1 hypothetical protein SERLA73DRAFT_71733 [Serpula lacrymans var. lacrymans S7.3]EGO26320.1 hypothetical protein SERLADRAFT_436135 [Serpula lacrymans var. lacrymans S7.9]